MIGSLIGILLAGLVVGCAVGSEEEQNTAGVLTVNSKSAEVEVPEGMTAKDVDHNSDGTIDIKDLVIVSKFFGQDVPEAEANAVAEVSDEDDPCIEIRKAEPYSNPKVEIVEDNTEFKKTFDAPNGNTYVYALVAVKKFRNQSIKNPPQAEKLEKYNTPSCIAMRFTIDENLLPEEVKVKPVAGHENMFSKTITSPLINKGRGWNELDGVWSAWIPSDQNDGWHIRLLRDFGANTWMDHDVKRMKRQLKKGIPISERSVIHKFWFLATEGDSYETFYTWQIWAMPNPIPFEPSKMGRDDGVYVNMLPEEVRRRYFPEDIN